MKRWIQAGIVCSVIIAGAMAASAQAPSVSIEAAESFQEGPLVRLTHFDVTLAGRLLTADEAIYNPNTGETELRGNVHLVLPPHLNNKMDPSTVH
jgi:hypothetical protein